MKSGTSITLKSGVPYCFRKHYPLIADLVRGAWARYVRQFNTQLLGTTSDIHEFLFGSERASLAAVKPILLEFQKGDCFYCQRPLRDESAHVAKSRRTPRRRSAGVTGSGMSVRA